MSYFIPYIDESGYHYPTYNEILEQLIDDTQTIFGSGTYLGSDSQDYQFLSKIAEKIYDTYQVCEIAYHSHSPISSIGASLDYIVAVNGIARKQATKSTVDVTLGGVAGTEIVNGTIADDNGFLWDLLDIVIVGDDGSASSVAVCRESGIVQAAPGSVTRIMTPTLGWETVTNDLDASTGAINETDSELRARQAESVAQPSQSILAGLKGALGSLEDVGRREVYENDTNVTDENGIPGHSICCVVEGGEDEEIAETIFLRKSCGCGTYGDSSCIITDLDNQEHTINFMRLQYVDIDIEIYINKRPGYTASIPDEVVSAIVEYLDTFSIGTDLTTSIIWMVAQQVNTDVRTPVFSISAVRAARHGSTLGQEDVVIDFNEVAKGRAQYITVHVS